MERNHFQNQWNKLMKMKSLINSLEINNNLKMLLLEKVMKLLHNLCLFSLEIKSKRPRILLIMVVFKKCFLPNFKSKIPQNKIKELIKNLIEYKLLAIHY